MFTIGEFSKLSRVSARMLRHYDRIGLLNPANVGEENGYRYYEASQLNTLKQIETWKGYGFTLAQISDLCRLVPEEQLRWLQVQRSRLDDQIRDLQRNLRRMENEIRFMEGTQMQREYDVIVMENPAQKVFGLRRNISMNGQEIHGLIQDMKKEAEKRGLKQAGPLQMVYLDEEFSHENTAVEIQMQVNEEHPDVKNIPGCTCAAAIHTGPLEEVQDAYGAICRWLQEHPEYHMAGPTIERYLKDERMARTPEELETGILFPVVKI
ncbi:MerR family transcriptional regulator [Diplocloster agilis]|uniref:MerR family transcriptional regulator n=1 Tax=Diplocloster agilis TaxID=2850323 RepID=A0A949NCL6_9FIRM|nr:MerR family transcriptional regulator [Diplocloster agilis]MBU9738842.1 MerR family transcriptional regulator [Diplocloster agilis]